MVDQTRLFPFPIDWANALKFSIEFRTGIFQPDDGREWRGAARTEPRLEYEYRGSVRDGAFQDLHRTLATVSKLVMVFGSPLYRTDVSTPLAGGTTTFDVGTVPAWLTDDRFIVLQNPFNPLQEDFLAQVVSVVGSLVTIDGPAPATFPVGSRVLMGFEFRLAGRQTATNFVNRVAAMTVKCIDEVGLNFIPETGAALPTIYRGKEVLLKKPNWAQPVTHDYRPRIDTLDFRFGVRSFEERFDFISQVSRALFLERTLEDALDFAAFFVRMRGKQTEFYQPSWLNELPLVAGPIAVQSTIDIQGEGFINFEDNVAQRNIFLALADGTYAFNRVNSMVAAAGVTTFTLDQPWAATVALDQIWYAGWLNTTRFAVDQLELEFVTDSVAQFNMSFEHVYDLDQAA